MAIIVSITIIKGKFFYIFATLNVNFKIIPSTKKIFILLFKIQFQCNKKNTSVLTNDKENKTYFAQYNLTTYNVTISTLNLL